jgi:hypothetical protein
VSPRATSVWCGPSARFKQRNDAGGAAQHYKDIPRTYKSSDHLSSFGNTRQHLRSEGERAPANGIRHRAPATARDQGIRSGRPAQTRAT